MTARKGFRIGLILAMFCATGAVRAQVDPNPPDFIPDMHVSVDSEGPWVLTHDQVIRVGRGHWYLVGSHDETGWALDWIMSAGQHTSVIGLLGGELTVTNLGNTARDFLVSLTMPIDHHPVTDYRGQFGVRLEDFNDDGFARLNTLSGDPLHPMFTGSMGSSTPVELFRLGLSCAASSGNCRANRLEETSPFGEPLRGGDTGTEMSILMAFNLSPGDRVVLDSGFLLTPIPLPATLPLFLSVLLPLYYARARGRRDANHANSSVMVANNPAAA